MSDANNSEIKKQWAKLKRQASEVAGEIHDVVEDTLWSDYDRLPELSQKLVEACRKAQSFQAEHGL
ncbi:MAG: hypothetical protein HQL67_04475 [Magnetococcales bacterium]|nr:hypothetical protein [Magnetococcales bacterium]